MARKKRTTLFRTVLRLCGSVSVCDRGATPRTVQLVEARSPLGQVLWDRNRSQSGRLSTSNRGGGQGSFSYIKRNVVGDPEAPGMHATPLCITHFLFSLSPEILREATQDRKLDVSGTMSAISSLVLVTTKAAAFTLSLVFEMGYIPLALLGFAGFLLASWAKHRRRRQVGIGSRLLEATRIVALTVTNCRHWRR